MKILYMFCGSLTAAWSVSDGIASELIRQGHQVLSIARGRMGSAHASLEVLKGADLIIVSGPEHIFGPQVRDNGARQPSEYSFFEDEATLYEWKHAVSAPKIFIYHESNRREDRTFGFEDLFGYADYHFFPAIQDAESYDQPHFAGGRSFWLPFGVDTNVFHAQKCTCVSSGGRSRGLKLEKVGEVLSVTAKCEECLGSGFVSNHKSVETGFIGLLYPKRVGFLNTLSQHMKIGRDPAFQIGRVQISDIEGTPYQENAERLAANYRRITVFLNLPHYSELLVTKVYEVMASGTFIATPILEGPAERNCEMFKHGEHLVYYRPSNAPFLAQTVREFNERNPLREKIALAGMAEVRAKHSLKQRVETLLEKCKIAKAVIQ